jgi:hypothetical protein
VASEEHENGAGNGGDDDTGALFGQLTQDLAGLLREELEFAAVERVPAIRMVLAELTGFVMVGVAGIFALAAATWAAGAGLAEAVPGWAAALILAAVWGAVAGGLLLVLGRRMTRRDPRLQWFLHPDPVAIERAHEEARAEAEDAVRESATRFAGAAVREIATGGLSAAKDEVEDVVEDVQDEVMDVLGESGDELAHSRGMVESATTVALLPARIAFAVVRGVVSRGGGDEEAQQGDGRQASRG